MSNYSVLKALLDTKFYENNDNEITGTKANEAVKAMVASLGAGYQFMGVAKSTDTPSGYSDLRCFWLTSEAGTYTNFGGQVIGTGITAIVWDSAWSNEQIIGIDALPIDMSNNLVSSGGLQVIFDTLKYELGRSFGATEVKYSGKYFDSYGGVGTKANLATNANFNCQKIKVSAGDVVVCNAVGNFAAHGLIFVDENNIIISSFQVISNAPKIVPSGCSYAIVNGDNMTPSIRLVDYKSMEAVLEERIVTKYDKDDLISGVYLDGYAGVGGTSPVFGINSNCSCLKPLRVAEGDKFRIKTISAFPSVANAVIFTDKDLTILYVTTSASVDSVFIAPAGSYYLFVNCATSAINSFLVNVLGVETNEANFTIPAMFYAIPGLEKSIYFDDILFQNDEAKDYSVEVTDISGISTPFSNPKRFTFTPSAAGSASLILNAYNQKKQLITAKNVDITILSASLPSVKRVWCTGDSITEAHNVPYYIEEALHAKLPDSSPFPVFVGTKGGPGGMGGKSTYHEAWWGRNYQWLAGIGPDKTSPLWNPNTQQIDVTYYRTNVLGLGASDYIDVCSLAMGFNDATSYANADLGFSAMQQIIAAFKADNPSTKFVVHLITYPAMGNVDFAGESNTYRKRFIEYFRNLCLAAYNDGQDANVIVGDFGLCYDRWLAYNRVLVNDTDYYGVQTEVILDRYHPSEDGSRQMGESIAPVILKLLQ